MLTSKLMAAAQKTPLVVILGATGTGKSKLAIELAKLFHGEVINADAMQVYKGLDIATNKVTTVEMEGVPHHLFGHVDPLRQYTAVDYHRDATPIVDSLLNSQKIPFVVGGTIYYIEALLWQLLSNTDLLCNRSDEKSRNVDENAGDSSSSDSELELDPQGVERTYNKYNALGNMHLYEMLKTTDPERAKYLHPNNRRKVIRSLEVCKKFGCTHSELLAEQHSLSANPVGGPQRYKNVVMFWVDCEQTLLDKRLDSRVDKMIEAGIVQELLDFHACYNEQRLSQDLRRDADYTLGIFQAIGFKEFHRYLILDDRSTEESEILFKVGIEQMKLRTRQFCRKQLKWIRNRLIRTRGRVMPSIYRFDSTFSHMWDDVTLKPASNIVQSMLDGVQPGISPVAPVLDLDRDKGVVFCNACSRYIQGSVESRNHFNSKRHKWNAKMLEQQQIGLAVTLDSIAARRKQTPESKVAEDRHGGNEDLQTEIDISDTAVFRLLNQ